MNQDDTSKFKAFMSALCEVYNTPLSEAKLNIYWAVLEEFSIAQIEHAIRIILRERTVATFPKPAEIVQAIEGTPSDNAMRVLALIEKAIINHGYYDSVDFGDPLIHICIDRMGGWLAISDLYRNEETWKFERKRFLAVYEAARKEVQGGGPSYLRGWFEISNSANGYPVPAVVRLGGPDQIRTKLPAYQTPALTADESTRVKSFLQGGNDGNPA